MMFHASANLIGVECLRHIGYLMEKHTSKTLKDLCEQILQEIQGRHFWSYVVEDSETMSKRGVALFTERQSRTNTTKVAIYYPGSSTARRCIRKDGWNCKELQTAMIKNLLGESEFTAIIIEIEFLVNERSLVYLEELRKRTLRVHKNFRNCVRRKLIHSELILLKGEGSRNSWKMGRVEKLIKKKRSLSTGGREDVE
ncbi:hypothetical protein DINM_000910 [Dirofilaria immitis]|nr:hypothetical protein [Dirofilaria immitis]